MAKSASTFTLYRCGPLDVSFHYSYSDELFQRMDAARPRSHRPRIGSLFCALTKAEAGTWWNWSNECRGNYGAEEPEPTPLWKLTVAGAPWLYPIEAYNRALLAHRAGDEEATDDAIARYWAAGVRLDDWYAHPHADRDELFSHRASAEALVDIDTVTRAVCVGGLGVPMGTVTVP